MSTCHEPAQRVGALTQYGPNICLYVYGKTVQITDSEHSIMEGFMVTNFNFHTSGYKPAAQTQHELPGNPTVAV